MSFVGKEFGRLIVLSDTGRRGHSREIVYLCKCECGNEIEVRSGLLSQGKRKSCGCLYEDTRIKDMTILNQSKKYIDGVHVGAFENRFNKNNTSGFKGVYKHNKGYRAKIVVKGVRYFGKTRATKEEAYRDRLKLEKELLPKRSSKL